MKTLEQILKAEKKNRIEGGQFGIKACKESIQFEVDFFNNNLYSLLEEYVKRANEDMFFNKAMVLACWEMINGK
jgi:hypothetical protein